MKIKYVLFSLVLMLSTGCSAGWFSYDPLTETAPINIGFVSLKGELEKMSQYHPMSVSYDEQREVYVISIADLFTEKSSKVNPARKDTLVVLVDLLKTFDESDVTVVGHADVANSYQKDKKIAKRRAAALAAYFRFLQIENKLIVTTAEIFQQEGEPEYDEYQPYDGTFDRPVRTSEIWIEKRSAN